MKKTVKKIRLKRWVENLLMILEALMLISIFCVFLDNIWMTLVLKVVLFIVFTFIGDILMKYTDLGGE